MNKNSITIKDIHTKRSLWKDKVRIFEFLYWNKNYNSLPLYNTWKKIIEEIKDPNKRLENKEKQIAEKIQTEATKIAEWAFYDEAVQEKWELTKISPTYTNFNDFFLLIKNGTHVAHADQWKEFLNLFTSSLSEWKKMGKREEFQPCFVTYNKDNEITLTFQNKKGYNLDDPNLALFWNNNLYFIKEFTYISNSNLHVEVKAQIDYIYSSYSNFLLSSGFAQVTNSPLYLDDPSICREYCQDMGVKSIYEWKTQNQPEYGLFYIDTEKWYGKFNEIKLGGGDSEGGGSKLSLPMDLKMKPLGTLKPWHITPMLAILAPKDFAKGEVLYYKTESEEIWNLPHHFSEAPHLLYSEHVTLQFFFLNKQVFTSPINLLEVVERKQEAPNDLTEEGKKEFEKLGPKSYGVKFKLRTIATPAGTFYIFSSGSIRHKWELDIKQKIQSGKVLLETILGGADVGLNFLAHWTGLKSKIATQTMKGMAKTGTQTTKKAFESAGLGEEPQEKPENEQHTERLFKSTVASAIKKLEPSILYSNTIDFQYDFAEFATRYSEPIMKIRTEWGTNLYDNLRANNNLSSSVVQFNNTFHNLARLLKKGYWKGNFSLNSDINGFMSSLFSKGIYFYEDLSDLSDPSLRRSRRFVQIVNDVNPTKVFISEEVVDTKHFREEIDYDALKAEDFHGTYIAFDNKEAQESFKAKFHPLLGNDNFIHYSDKIHREGVTNRPKKKVTAAGLASSVFVGAAAGMGILSIATGALAGLSYVGGTFFYNWETSCGWCWKCTYELLEKKNFFKIYNWECPADCTLVLLLEVGKQKDYKLVEGIKYNIEFTPTAINLSWDEIEENTIEVPEVSIDTTRPELEIKQDAEITVASEDASSYETVQLENAIAAVPVYSTGTETEKPYEEEKEPEKEPEVEKEATRHKYKEKMKKKEKEKQPEPEKQQEFWGSEEKEKSK